jgi:hypothetical protein
VYEPINAPVRKLRLAAFICPSEVEDLLPGSNYAGCHHDVEAPIDADNHGTLFLNSHVSSDDIPDGAGHTIFVGEKTVMPGDFGWTSGTRATLRNTGHRINTAPLSVALADENAPAAEGKTPPAEGAAPAEGSPPAEGKAPADDKAPAEGDAPAAESKAPVAEGKSPAADPTDDVLYVGGFASHHPMGAFFGLGDGNVRFILDDIDPTVFQQLGNRADGALIDDQLLR